MHGSQPGGISRAEKPLELGLRSSSDRLPLARLLQLVLILQSERFPNTRRLAEACGVSRRTIYRDLATLEDAGIEVVYQPERQGYQLAGNCWLQPTQLDEMEALGLLFFSRLGCSNLPLGLSRHAQNGLAKVILSLPGNLRQRLADSGELLGDDPLPGAIPSDRQLVHETICRALAQRKRVRMLYRERDGGQTATTRFGLYRLACHQMQWCVVGHSTADRRVRVFEIAQIERLELTDEPYAIPPRFRLEKFFDESTNHNRLERSDVRPASSGDTATTPRETALGNSQRLGAGRDRTVELSLESDQIDNLLRLLTDRGDHIDVIEPEKRGHALGE